MTRIRLDDWTPTTHRGPASAWFSALVAVIAVVTACASLGARAKFAATSCGQAAVKAGADDLAGAVAGILTGGAASWEAQLEALAAKLGLDAVGCAVMAFLAGPPATGPADLAAPIKLMAASPEPLARAKRWLAAHQQ